MFQKQPIIFWRLLFAFIQKQEKCVFLFNMMISRIFIHIEYQLYLD